jgi:aspartyl-tRNA(Asn)/glutamyl-tRNA(Gln) amidotransferase subunit A
VTLLESARALRERKISSLELTEQALKRVAATAQLNAFITVVEDAARARAREMDADLGRGVDRGPLHGIPIAHKDAIETAGVRTTTGSKILSDFVPAKDADLAAHLHDAGAVMIGKTNLHELCHGITSGNPHFGVVHNPWDLNRIPGGSSGGSAAAVAAGVVAMATGTDTGGSIRIPASYCGVVGLKPTFGRVSCRGVLPLAFTLDHAGPIARTVRDTAVSFHAMLGESQRHGAVYVPPQRVDLAGLRIGVPENFFFDRLAPEVHAAVRKAVQTLAGLGAQVSEVRLPDPAELNTTGRLIQLAEASSVWKPHSHRRADFGADVFALLQQGLLLSATDYLDAQRLRRLLVHDFSKIWSQVDCLIAPATAVAAPRIGEAVVRVALEHGGSEEDVRLASTRLTRPFNVLGWPALALPCGFSEAGLPIGLQLAAAPHQENMLLRAGAALEDTLGLASRAPEL